MESGSARSADVGKLGALTLPRNTQFAEFAIRIKSLLPGRPVVKLFTEGTKTRLSLPFNFGDKKKICVWGFIERNDYVISI
jgi:hypothetical protein